MLIKQVLNIIQLKYHALINRKCISKAIENFLEYIVHSASVHFSLLLCEWNAIEFSVEYVERSEKLSRFHQITEENKRNKK